MLKLQIFVARPDLVGNRTLSQLSELAKEGHLMDEKNYLAVNLTTEINICSQVLNSLRDGFG